MCDLILYGIGYLVLGGKGSKDWTILQRYKRYHGQSIHYGRGTSYVDGRGGGRPELEALPKMHETTIKFQLFQPVIRAILSFSSFCSQKI